MAFDIGELGRLLGRGADRLFNGAEDDQLVDTNKGLMPLWKVEGDTQRIPSPVAPQRQSTRMPLVGAVTQPGVQVTEDDFTFPFGGQFVRRTDGSAFINGGQAAPGSQLQEDNFSFGNRLPQQRPPISLPSFEDLLRRR